jgi:hypothetical protein
MVRGSPARLHTRVEDIAAERFARPLLQTADPTVGAAGIGTTDTRLLERISSTWVLRGRFTIDLQRTAVLFRGRFRTRRPASGARSRGIAIDPARSCERSRPGAGRPGVVVDEKPFRAPLSIARLVA